MKIYKISEMGGEWWIIDGTAIFADANIGDYNHSGIVIEHILGYHDLDPLEVNLDKENEESLRQKGFNQEEINALLDKTDPREYGLKHLGWKRVHGNNVQTQTLTKNDLNDIANGLFDINEDCENETFNIEVSSTGNFYKNIPYAYISDGTPSQLGNFKYAMNKFAINKKIDVGGTYWFEYHCYESTDSCDAHLWFRSHQKIKVLKCVEKGCGKTEEERAAEGCPAVYNVEFEDGFKYDVFEDEIMMSPKDFFRPDPPKDNFVKSDCASPSNIYCEYDVIQKRNDLAPSRRRRRKKRIKSNMNWYKKAQFDYPYSLLEEIQMQKNQELIISTMDYYQLKKAKELEEHGFIKKKISEDKHGKYAVYIINPEKFKQMGWEV